MRQLAVLLCSCIAAAGASPALATDILKFGAAPSWIAPQVIPSATDKTKDRPIAILLHDQQSQLEPGKITTYSAVAFKIQKPEGLAAGNLSIAWNPAFDTATVNRLEIRRGDQVIDVLKSGQTFTTMRRESNLDLAMLDGVLTANIQPEGLQEGDVVVLATTIEHVDPVLKGHVEATFAPWGDAQIGLAHARLTWPSTLDVRVQKTGDLPAAQAVDRDGKKVFDMTMRDVEPVISPKGAPLRFMIGRMGEATDFRSWADAAKLMMPLYRDAATIPLAGSLREEVERIRKASADPKIRAEQALQLVQQRIRYVALAMGEGGLVPASAETTWSRRFGDCKAKTALLLAILHELGIDAEPVLVNAAAGDAVADRLPMIGSFNHVLVRAHVGGKDRWLDGTRSGDTSLDRLQIPKFGWGLPLVDKATLVRIMPLPLDSPDSEVRIAIDASAGIFTPAAVTIEQVLRGDGAVAFNNGYSQLSADQQTEFLHKAAKDYFDSIGGDSSTVAFDKSGGELRISTKGTAKLDWEDGWYAVPDTSIAYDPDFERPAGPRHDVPFATDYPNFNKRLVTIKLPSGFATHQSKLPQPVHETLTGIEYDRTINLTGDVLKVESSERTVAPEVPYKTAVAAAPRLKALNNDDVYLRVPSGYVASAQDLISRAGEKPASAQDFIDRGLMMLDASKFDQAIADFDGALGLDPKNVWALADRGIARIWKRNFDEAAKDLAAVEAVDPRNSVLLRAKGLRAEIQGDLKTAVEFYSKSLEQEPGNSFALARRGEAQQMQGKMAEALKDYDALVARNPKSENALAIRATALASLGRFAAAEGDIRSALAINPNSAPAYDARGKIASVQGDMAGAVEAYTQELRIAPDALSALSGRTAAYRNLRHYDLALADADTGLKAKPGWPEMRVARANVLLLQGKRQDVEKEAELLESENPNSEFAFVAAARIYAALGQHEKAMGTFSHALKIKPAAYIYVNRAQSRPYTDFTGRIADLDSALQLEPDNADALSTKANVLATMGKYAEAIALYDRVPKLPGNAISVAAMRAVLLQKSGDTTAAQKAFADARLAATTSGDLNELCWNKAIGDVMLESAVTDCRTALERSPDNPAYLDSLGMALLKLGKLDEALNAYDRAIEKNSGPTSYMGRAFVYLRKGDLTHAEADAQVARKRLAGIDDQFAQYGLKFEVKAAASTSAK